MGDPAILIVNAQGIVVDGNAAADTRFGSVRGRRCAEVVCVRVQGVTRCRAGCVAELLEAGTPSRVRGSVRARHAEVRCAPLLSHALVTVDDTALLGRSLQPLTRRESEVLHLVADGMTTQRVASALGIQYSTARTHIENIRHKLESSTRAEAISKAHALGWLDRQHDEPTSTLNRHSRRAE